MCSWSVCDAVARKQLVELHQVFVEEADEGLIHHLLRGLRREGVLNDKEVEEVKKKTNSQHQARILHFKVLAKDPPASTVFLKLYRQREKSGARNPGLTSDLSGIAVPSERKNGIRLCPLDHFQKMQDEKAIYPIKDRSARTRLALIICNIDFVHHRQREGAKEDVKKMTLLLEGLDYTVQTEINLTMEDMATALKRFAARSEHMTSDSTFLVLMSHGNENGLLGVDSQGEDVLPIDTVFSTFNNQNCPALLKKPKVIIIQACRGKDNGAYYESDCAGSPAPHSSAFPRGRLHRIQKESDFACLNSTTLSTKAWRHRTDGSPFINKLIELIKEHAWHDDLEEIFRKVLQAFAEMSDGPLQMPCKDRTTLLRKFYLFPGH